MGHLHILELPKQILKMRAVLLLALLIVLVAAVDSGKSFNRHPKVVRIQQKVSGIKNGVRNKIKSKIAKIKGFFSGVGNKFRRKLGKREAEPGHLRIRNKYNSVKRKVSQKV